MKNKSVWILILVLVLLVGGVALAYSALSDQFGADQFGTVAPNETDGSGETQEKEPIPAPDFTVYDAEGNPVKLSDFRGKPVVLNFWSSNCGPCKHEMPVFQKTFEAMGDEIHFLMVNMTDNSWDTLDTAKAFIAEGGYTFPVYFDTDLSAAIAYGIRALPTTYFIDADGNMVVYARGAMTEEMLHQGIDMIPKK